MQGSSDERAVGTTVDILGSGSLFKTVGVRQLAAAAALRLCSPACPLLTMRPIVFVCAAEHASHCVLCVLLHSLHSNR